MTSRPILIVAASVALILAWASTLAGEPVDAAPAICQITAPTSTTREWIPGVGLVERTEANRCLGTLVGVGGPAGQVLTCWHWLRDAAGPISIEFPDGQRSAARVIASDQRYDLALLEISAPTGIRPIRLAARDPLAGEPVILAGLGPSGRQFIPAAVRGYQRTAAAAPHDQLTAAAGVADGSSGGPILTPGGDLAGVIWGTAYRETVGTCAGRIRQLFGGFPLGGQASPRAANPGCTGPFCQQAIPQPGAACCPPGAILRGRAGSYVSAPPAVIPAPPETGPLVPVAPPMPVEPIDRSVELNLDDLLDRIVERLPKPQKGDKGDKGDQGDQGPAGECPVDSITAAVAQRLGGRLDAIEAELRDLAARANQANTTADGAKRSAEETDRQLGELTVKIKRLEGLDVGALIRDAIGSGQVKFRVHFDRSGQVTSITPLE